MNFTTTGLNGRLGNQIVRTSPYQSPEFVKRLRLIWQKII